MENQNSETTENTIYKNTVETQTEKKKSRTPWVIAGILLVLLLAGAAFVGGSLLGLQSAPMADEMAMGYTPAKEIPETEPELMGTVSKMDGDTLSVAEFSMNDMMMDAGAVAGEGGVFVEQIEISEDEMENLPEFFGADGPVTEVVITHDTKIYKDTTFQNFDFMDENAAMDGNITMPEHIDQTVEPGTAEEIGTGAMVTIWGERRGDRVIASFVLYEPAIEFYFDGEGQPGEGG